MRDRELKDHISWLENLLDKFREEKKRGKETNSNEVRAHSISEIEGITRRLEEYIRSNNGLIELIAGSKIGSTTEVEWNDIVRPGHFEEDLGEEVRKLQKKLS